MRMKFNELLQQLRSRHQLSQEELAERINVSRQAVAKWEAGNTMPDLTNLIILSDLFSVSLDRLLKGEESTCSKNLFPIDKDLDDDLLDFLFEAKLNTYASGAAENKTSSRPNSHDLTYIDGNMCYIDTYLGSEKFSGQEALWIDEVAIWTMNYIGRVLEERFSGDFLKTALTIGIHQNVVRGPELYKEGDYTYHSEYKGTMEWFQGYETIYYLNVKVYECYFHGGIITQ